MPPSFISFDLQLTILHTKIHPNLIAAFNITLKQCEASISLCYTLLMTIRINIYLPKNFVVSCHPN